MENEKNVQVEKEYYTKAEVNDIINKKVLEITSEIISRIDAKQKEDNKKEEKQRTNFNF